MLQEATHKAKIDRIRNHRMRRDVAMGRVVPIVEQLQVQKEAQAEPLPAASEIDSKGNAQLFVFHRAFLQADRERVELARALDTLIPVVQQARDNATHQDEMVEITRLLVDAKRVVRAVRRNVITLGGKTDV